MDDGSGLAGNARERHRQRLDLINRGVRGVKLPRQIVKGDIAIRGAKG